MTDADPTHIRLARPNDLAALGRLGGLLVRSHHAFDAGRFLTPPPDVESGYAQFLGGELDNPDSVVFVAEHQGLVVGYVYAGLEPPSWKELREAAGFIHDLVVDERARGRGVAGQLLETAAAWLVERGAPRILLWTAFPNAAAQRVFEKAGFRKTMIEMTRESAP